MSAVDHMLARARSGLDRLTAEGAARAVEEGALLVDVRTGEQRAADGGVPGALPIGLNVLEWRLDPGAATVVPQLQGAEQPVILMCNEGFSSSLAAARLQELGLVNATDVIGGFRAWRDAGLPVLPP